MANEIDARIILRTMLRQWYLIVGIPALFVLVAVGVCRLRYQETFEAAAHVVIDSVTYEVERNTQFGGVAITPVQPPNIELAAMASTDFVLRQALEDLQESSTSFENLTLETLQRMVTINSRQDSDLITFVVRTESAADSEFIANSYASSYIQTMDELFSYETSDRVESLEAQLQEVETELDTLERAINDIPEGAQGRAALQARLDATQEIYRSLVLTIGLSKAGLDKDFELRMVTASRPISALRQTLPRYVVAAGVSGAAISMFAVLFIDVLKPPSQADQAKQREKPKR